MRLKWFPWWLVIRYAAQAEGFLDPILLLARLRRFAQPAEVLAPTELLRAGAVLHARGLINSQAIQHNLDWVWPYWVTRQFDPYDDAFVPRAFSLTHINLTHRNWTAVGIPDGDELPIVDPRGLLTPHLDGWSIDTWIIAEDGRSLLPSRMAKVAQRLRSERGLAVETVAEEGGLQLTSTVDVAGSVEAPVCRLRVSATANLTGWLVIALRPYNPEGVSFINRVELQPDRRGWLVNGKHAVWFHEPAERHGISTYRQGDVYRTLPKVRETREAVCDVGMATAAALFLLQPKTPRTIEVTIPLGRTGFQRDTLRQQHVPLEPGTGNALIEPAAAWRESLAGACRLAIPDARLQSLYDIALQTLVLHAPGDVYPGPYTYKRFWFRDAAFILHALLSVGLTERAERALDRFPARQTAFGYFRSQDGEWDSNGEALWILQRFCELTGRTKPAWANAMRRGAHWIDRKCTPDGDGSPHAGLLPAGFSAEHLGPNDFYYWDDFWSVAGLRAAAGYWALHGEPEEAAWCRARADRLMQAIERSLAQAQQRLGHAAMPASPTRRMDAGAIGSIAAGYPLQLFAADDLRLSATVRFLLERCFIPGGFFQDMSHSGINPYLTLHVAQVLLRAGDRRFGRLIAELAELASPTGQWPEAVHPRTRGGCMGDGQHVWAAAEWVLMLRNCFVREEEGGLTLGSGLLPEWLTPGAVLRCGPTPTRFGPVTFQVTVADTSLECSWESAWRGQVPTLDIQLPGRGPFRAAPGHTTVTLPR